MRTAGVLAAMGLVHFVGAFAACSSDEPAGAAPPVAEAGSGTEESGPAVDASEGGTTSAPGAAKRGTRLAPQFRETADGLSEFYAMIDTGLGDLVCSESRAGDGEMRCLPQASASLFGETYADENCMTELAMWSAGCAKPTFAIQSADPGSCTTTNEVFDVGAQHTTQIYQKQGPTTCVPIGSDVKQSYYVVGAKRAPTDFVKLTQRIQPIGGGVGVAMLDGDDGSTAPKYLFVDIARNRACIEGKAADLKTRCVPSFGGYTGNAFVDGTCMKEAAQVFSGDCGDPLMAPDTATSNVPNDAGTVRIFELGAKQPTKDVFRHDEQLTCGGPFAGSDDVYERGPEIPAATFPELGLTTVGGARIVAGRWTAGGVVLPVTSGFHDKMLDVKCTHRLAIDGKYRCLPFGSVRVFTDDQCMVGVATENGPPPKYVLDIVGACPTKLSVYPVGAEVLPKPEKLWGSINGACTEISPPGTNTVYATGAEVPPSTFAEVTLVTK